MPSISLYLTAFRLGLIAQRLKQDPIESVIQLMRQTAGDRRETNPRELEKAVRRIMRVLGRLKLLNTCLVAALVFAVMWHDKSLKLALGFSDSLCGDQSPDGHAWLESDNGIVFDLGNPNETKNRYTVHHYLSLGNY